MKGLIFITVAAYMVYVAYCQQPSVNCPPYDDDMKEPVLVKHPCNCSAYYVCVPPANIPMPCPPGLQFNETTQRCDWPWNVHCKPEPGCTKVANAHEVVSQKDQEAHEVVSQEDRAAPQEVHKVVSQEEQGRLSNILL